MPQAALGRLQPYFTKSSSSGSIVSMPQAALGRLQLKESKEVFDYEGSFDAASGIRSVATSTLLRTSIRCRGFDAASGIRSVATISPSLRRMADSVSMPQAALGRLQPSVQNPSGPSPQPFRCRKRH